jgi:hypothetical protein
MNGKRIHWVDKISEISDKFEFDIMHLSHNEILALIHIATIYLDEREN